MAQVSGIEVRFSGNTAPLEQAVSRAQGALGNFQRAANDAVPAAFGSKIQNIGFQVQDFAVQVASGTTATRAFAQQAPQLLSSFGTLGVVLGTVAAVAVPLAGSFIDAGVAAKGLGAALQTVGPYAAVATAALAGFYAPSLLAGIATTTSAIGVGLVGSIKAVTAAMMANPLGLLVAGVATAAVALFAFRDDIKQVLGIDVVGIAKNSVNFVIRGFMNLKDVIKITFENLGNIVGAALVGISNIVLRTITNLSNKVIDGLNYVVGYANKIPGVTIGAFQKLEGYQFPNVFADGAARAGQEIGRAMAENAAKDYVGAMGEFASNAMSKVGELFSGFGGATDAATGKTDKVQETSVNPSQEPGTYFTDRLQMIRDQFKTERQVLEEEYAADRDVLRNALLNGKLKDEEEYVALSTELARKHQADLAAIQQSRLNTDLQAASDFFGSMQGIAQMGGKKMLKVAKAFGAAQALVATFQAAAQAMADWSSFTPMQKLANFAAIVAQGMSAVRAIKGVSEGGGGGGGAVSAGGRGGMSAASAGGGGSSPTTTFQFTLMNDPMGFGEKFARQFIDQLNSTQRNGGQIRGVIA